MKRKSRFSDDDIQKMHDVYTQERLTLEKVGERFGVNRQAVYKLFAKKNLPRRIWGPQPAIAKVYSKDRRKGLTYKEIAEKHGVSKQAVWHAIRLLSKRQATVLGAKQKRNKVRPDFDKKDIWNDD